MNEIKITKQEETGNGWKFEVDVDGSVYSVSVPKEYWQKLTEERMQTKELVRKSFEFLLAREPKGSILQEFELPTIQKYFPEYESKIQDL